MGPDDPTVRGRRISRLAMRGARTDFAQEYREPIEFALELVDRIRAAVAKAIEKNGSSEDGDYEEEIGMRAWKEIASDPSVRKRLAEVGNVDASSVQPF